MPAHRTSDTAADSILDARASRLPIKRWKLIECGSGLSRCAVLGDWRPGDSIEALCRRIAASGEATCDFESQPLDAHLTCAVSDRGVDSCRLWFDKLAAR